MIKYLMMMSLLCLGLSAHAQKKSSYSSYNSNGLHEVDVNLSNGSLRSYKIGDDSFTDINIYGAYHRYLQDHIQIGGEGGLLSYHESENGKVSTKTNLALMGVVTYNLDNDFSNSFFGNVGAGLYPSYVKSKAKYESKFSFFFDVGKRIPLWDHVTYKPFFRLAKYGDQDLEFLIMGLNVSLMF